MTKFEAYLTKRIRSLENLIAAAKAKAVAATINQDDAWRDYDRLVGSRDEAHALLNVYRHHNKGKS